MSIKIPLLDEAALIAAMRPMTTDERGEMGLQLVVCVAGGLAVFVIPAILSTYKPRGVMGRGVRDVQRRR